jgi:MFS family permease
MELPYGALPATDGASLDLIDGRHVVRYRMAVPFFGFLFAPLVRRRARRIEAAADAGRPLPNDAPWWSAPVPLGSDSTRAVASICLLALLTGYASGLLTQTLPYAAKVYHVGDQALGTGLAVVRVGVLLALGLGPLADRHGRRRFVVIAAIAEILVAAAVGFAPTFATYIGVHILLRCVDTALSIALVVLAAEIVPAGSRAFVVSLVTVAGGAGGAVAVVLLPLAARGRVGLSATYFVQLLAIPLVLAAGHHLSESTRYLRHAGEPHRYREVTGRSGRGRLALVGGALLLASLFFAPATEFSNRYLDTVRHFPSTRIVLFLTFTTLPFLPALLWGARAADRRGRKVVGVPSAIIGTAAFAGYFVTGAPWLWLFAFVGWGAWAPAVAALGVYGPELFPTRIRSAANTLVNIMGVLGSAVGLVLAGRLSARLGIGHAVATLAVFPVLAAIIVAVFFPETARKELEETSGEHSPGPMTSPPNTRSDSPPGTTRGGQPADPA